MDKKDEREIVVEVDEERAKYLLTTLRNEDRRALVDMIKEITEAIGAQMDESVEANLMRYATLPALQMLLAGILGKDSEALDMAATMIAIDTQFETQRKIDEHPEDYIGVLDIEHKVS